MLLQQLRRRAYAQHNPDQRISAEVDPFCSTAAAIPARIIGTFTDFTIHITDRLDLHGVLDFRQHSRADEDLPWLGLIAKPRGDVGDGPDGGIVKSALEADCAERSEAMRMNEWVDRFAIFDAVEGRDIHQEN